MAADIFSQQPVAEPDHIYVLFVKALQRVSKILVKGPFISEIIRVIDCRRGFLSQTERSDH